MSLSKTVISCIFCLLVIGHISARELKVSQISRNSDIPAEFVDDIELLDNGYLLFSTDAGAKLYSGYEFLSLLPADNVAISPLDSSVYHSLQDDQGNIWFATGIGLYMLPQGASQLVKFSHNPKDPNSLVNDNVRKIMQDSQGNLWFGTLIGVSRYSPETKTFLNFEASEQVQARDFIRNVHVLIEDAQQTVWFGGLSGLFYVDLKTLTLQQKQGELADKYYTSAILARDNKIWFGTDSHGIIIYDPLNDATQVINLESPAPLKLRSNSVWSLFQDQTDLVWVGYWDEGVTVLDLAKHKTYQILSRTNELDTLPHLTIRDIAADSSGLIWIATVNGAAFFDPATIPFESISHIPGDNNSINDSLVMSVLDKNDGVLWLGTEKGLEKWDLEKETSTHYYHDAEDDKSVVAGVIWRIREFGDNQLLLATDSSVELFDIASGKIKHFNQFKSKSGKILKSGFYDITPADGDRFYVSSNAATIHLLNPHTGETELVFDSIESERTSEIEYFSRVLLGSDNSLWAGSTTGLYKINLQTKQIDEFNSQNKTNYLSSNTINDLYFDEQKNLWVATASGGINKISMTSDGEFTTQVFSKKDGLPADKILSLIAGSDGFLWFTTGNKFGSINRITHEIKNYSLLSSNDRFFAEGSGGISRRGEILLGGSEVTRFDPKSLTDSTFEPEIRLTGVSRLHYPVSEFLPLGNNKKIEFFPEDSLISFHFASLDYANSHENQYRYMLQDVDKDWLFASNLNRASYTHLSGGNYKFIVQGTNRDGKWSSKSATLEILVHPPIWKSWYAYLFYALVLISITGFIVNARRQKHKAEMLAIEAVKQSESRLRDVLWGSGDELWQWDLRTNEFTITNDFSHEISSKGNIKTFDEMFGQLHPDDQAETKCEIERYLKGEKDFYEAQFRILDPDKNTWRWVLSRGRIVERDSKNTPIKLAGTRKDISDMKKTESQLRHLANYDQLTQLPNRSSFHEHLTRAITFAARFDEKIALLFFDLDGFKLINDSLGHGIGDQLLQAVAHRLQKMLRETEYIARLGGDEFTIIMERVKDTKNIANTLNRLTEELSRPFELMGQTVVTSVSIGISVYPEDGETPSSLLKHADIAMYEAKRNGKKQFCFFESQMNDVLVKRLDIEQEIGIALLQSQFETYYQPRVCVSNNELKGFEALIRWHHPTRGFVSPTEFIPVAEETGQILEIGEWVLNDACRQCAQWHSQGNKVRVSVNIAALQFQQSDLVQSVIDALEKSGLKAHWLELEITEGTLIRNMEHTSDIILKLKKLGVHIALDDFGTGYSSLAYLQQLPIDVLKIDRVFINQLRRSKKSLRLSRAIINMAHSLDLEVVAEGIEEQSQLDFLKEAGCEEYQGYLYGKPIKASEISFEHKPSNH